MFSAQQKFDWLKLSLSENIGPVAFKELLAYFGSPQKAIAHLSRVGRAGRRPVKLADDRTVETQLKLAEKYDASILCSGEPDFPALLKQIPDCPPVLFCRGFTQLLNREAVAFVGTRNASLNGCQFAKYLANEISFAGYQVVSGLARGIDGACHAGALKDTSGNGGTIAVLGTGVEKAYPAENQALYDEICARGCVISEQPFESTLTKGGFSRRNRLISGLSKGVVVIEATKQSGSLITAKYALEQGREVFAVPGNPIDARSEGTNALIQEGATLVTKPADILDVLTGMKKSYRLFEPVETETFESKPTLSDDEFDRARQTVESALGAEPVDINALIEQTGLPTALVHVILVEMELTGDIERHPNNGVSRLYRIKE